MAVVARGRSDRRSPPRADLRTRLRDPCLWLAFAAGPAVWAALAVFFTSAGNPEWLAAHPGTFLLLAGVYPVLEEFVFRGGIQPAIGARLSGGLGPLSWANALTSIMFCALHLIYHPPVWAAAVFAPSLVFGYFRERHGGLASPIALHVFYNAGYFALFGA